MPILRRNTLSKIIYSYILSHFLLSAHLVELGTKMNYFQGKMSIRFVLVHRKIRFRFVLVHRKIRLPVPNLTILRFLDIDKKTKLHNHHLEISDRIKIFSRILIFAWLYFSFEVQIRFNPLSIE